MNKKLFNYYFFNSYYNFNHILFKLFQNPSEQKLDETEKTEALIESKIINQKSQYNVNFDDNVQYSITAELSEIFYEQESDLLKCKLFMQELLTKMAFL